MSERVPCPHCGKRLHDRPAVYQHIKAKHGGKGKNAYRTVRESSMADLFVQAQINRSMGVRNEEWLEEMLP